MTIPMPMKTKTKNSTKKWARQKKGADKLYYQVWGSDEEPEQEEEENEKNEETGKKY